MIFLALAAIAAGHAQNVAPKKESDEEVLRRAIEAVDRAKEKIDKGDTSTPAPPPKPAPAPAASASKATPPKTTPPATPAVKPVSSATGQATEKKPAARQDLVPTTIIGEEDAIFQNKEGIIIFRKNVEVNKSDLKIWCQELHLTLNRTDSKKPAPAAASRQEADSGDMLGAGNLKTAVAKAAPGGVVVIWRKTLDGEMVANCREAVYDGATGTITLKGKPEVLKDVQTFVFGKSDSDTMLMTKTGYGKGAKGFQYFNTIQQGQEVRRRLLSSIPPKKKEAIESIDVPVPPPATGTNDNSPSN